MVRKHVMVQCLLVSMFILIQSASAQLNPDNVSGFTLPNGMKFLVHEDHSIPNVAMYLHYRVGSRNEHQGITGLAHFFEHMMFNGAKKYGPKQFDQVLEWNGGSTNAYTSNDLTVYTNWFPAQALPVMFDLESDRMQHLRIDPQIVESERGVVLSERSTNIENSPWTPLYYAVCAQAFMEHPYHWPVIGYEADIRNWTKSDLEKFYRTYYAPNNCLVVITGSVSSQQVRKLAENHFAKASADPDIPVVKAREPIQQGQRRIILHKDVTSPYLFIAFKGPETTHRDFAALQLLGTLLSSGQSSRLYHALVDSLEVASYIETSFDRSFDPFLFQFYATASKEHTAEKLELEIFNVLEKMKIEGPQEKELQKAKNIFLLNHYRSMETINGKADLIGRYELFTGSYTNLFKLEEEINNITTADIRRVATEYLHKEKSTVGFLLPNQK